MQFTQSLYSQAGDLLDSFPRLTDHDDYIVDGQLINLERLRDTSFVLSGTEKDDLLDIAMAESPDAGYAQALLSLLIDTMFMPTLPDIGEESFIALPPQLPVADISVNLQIYPNPTDDILNIQIPIASDITAHREILLHEMITGRLVKSIDVSNLSIVTFTLDDFISGVYMATLNENGVATYTQRFIIQY